MTEVAALEGTASARGRRVAIIAARFNDFIVRSLLDGAVAAFAAAGGDTRTLLVARVPGAFELPVAARAIAASGRCDALVALGCVIRGDTPHFEYVAGECARGLQQVSIDAVLPVAFGVLTVDSVEQALERAATTGANKGGEAMQTALEMADLLARLR